MKFIDYEKKIRDSHPLLVESYVRQYGEKWRKHIEDVLDNIKYCLYATPLSIREYVFKKKDEDFAKAVLATYEELGIDDTKTKVGNLALEDDVNEIDVINKSLFDFEYPNIFLFEDCYDEDWKIIEQRMQVFENLKLKDKDMSEKEFIASGEYDKALTILKNIYEIFAKNNMKYHDHSDDELISYSFELEEKMKNIGKELERDFFRQIMDLLDEDDKKIVIDENRDIRDLKSYWLYCSHEDDSLVTQFLDSGLIDYFSDEYNELLADDDYMYKDDILRQRVAYFQEKGIKLSMSDVADLENNELVRNLLPDQDVINRIVELREKYYELYLKKIVKLCLINDFAEEDLTIDDIQDILEDESLGMRSFDEKSQKFSIFLSIFNDMFNSIDVTIDHELRHAIETSIKRQEDRIIEKVGSSLLITEYVDGEAVDQYSMFLALNERMTEALSMEATDNRWKRGQFILSDSLAPKLVGYLRSYEVDNVNIILNPFRSQLLEARISPNFDDVEAIIPRELLWEIDNCIDSNHPSAIASLKKISEYLAKNEKMKVKK